MTVQDPRLKCAANEISQILRKYDLAATFFLADGDGHGEWRMAVDFPTWSMIRFVKGGKGIHLKAYTKSKPVETGMTVNAIIILQDMMSRIWLSLDEMVKQVKSLIEVEESGGKWEDRDEDT